MSLNLNLKENRLIEKEITNTINLRKMKGTVKWYDAEKGYGFILTEEGKDLFVHRSGLTAGARSLDADDRVEFEVSEGPKGLIAVNVVVD